MKSKFTRLLVVSALFCLMSESLARPTKGAQRNQTKQGLKKGKHGLWPGRARSDLREKTSKHKSATRNRFPSALNSKGRKEQKRQYIMRPQISLAGNPLRPYMVIRPPPMTQKTIVTTHIPRPPMTLPYNPYLLMHPFFGGAHVHGLPYGEGLATHMYEGDEEIGRWTWAALFDNSLSF